MEGALLVAALLLHCQLLLVVLHMPVDHPHPLHAVAVAPAAVEAWGRGTQLLYAAIQVLLLLLLWLQPRLLCLGPPAVVPTPTPTPTTCCC
jgi:hypothetical protein